MTFRLVQQNSWGSATFDVISSGEKIGVAQMRPISAPNQILFENYGNRQNDLVITSRGWGIVPKYDLITHDGFVYRLRPKSFWKRYFELRTSADKYEVYGHVGHKFSIYKNDVQIGWWDRNSTSWFENNVYDMQFDKDENYQFLVGFCLIVADFYYSSAETSTHRTSLGYIGGEIRKFNPEWKPR